MILYCLRVVLIIHFHIQSIGNDLEFLIKIRTKLPFDSIFDEKVYRYIFHLTMYPGRVADLPAVIVHCFQAVVIFHAYGIYMAGHRLTKTGSSFLPGLLNATAGDIVIKYGIGTFIFPVYKCSNHFLVRIQYGGAQLFY